MIYTALTAAQGPFPRAPSLIGWKHQPYHITIILTIGSCNFARSKINAISKIHQKIANSFKALKINVMDNLLKSKILNLKKLISP